jgi:succinoglycan biosynthesis protein ExoV
VSAMELYYYKDSIGNFGDDLNNWLWPRLFPYPMADAFDPETLFVGIGSLLNHKIPASPPKKIIFGSGYGYGDPPEINDQWRFYCVRGPLTAKLLNLPESLVISDSALLIRKLVNSSGMAKYPVAFMPHHQTSRYDDWRSICGELGIQYLDPADSVGKTIEDIRSSSLVVTEAMHGAIVADALRVPWIPVRTRKRILDFKWQDWLASLQMDHHFEWLTPAWSANIDREYKRRLYPISKRIARERLKWIVRFGKKKLSDEKILNGVYQRMTEKFDRLLTDGRMKLDPSSSVIRA